MRMRPAWRLVFTLDQNAAMPSSLSPDCPRPQCAAFVGSCHGSEPRSSLRSGREAFDRPVTHAVGGVVEHLADDLPSNPGIGTALYLYNRGYAVLINEQVVY